MVSLRETYQRLQSETSGQKEPVEERPNPDAVKIPDGKRPAIALHQVRDSPWQGRQPPYRQQTSSDVQARSWIIGVLAVVFIAMCLLYAYVSKATIPTPVMASVEASLAGAYPDAEIVPEL